MHVIRNALVALGLVGAGSVGGYAIAPDGTPSTPGLVVICPDGWTPGALDLIDAVSLRCLQGDSVAIVDEDGNFLRGWTGNMPAGEFIEDASQMPGWER